MASESSAVIQFIADNQRHPVDRGIFSRKYGPAQPVLLATVPSPWKARLTIAASLLVVGVATGLYAGQTDGGRGFIAGLTSTQSELATAQPAPPAPLPAPRPAAAIAPCPSAAPAPVALAAAPAPAPAPPPAVPVLAVTASVPPAPAPAAAVATPKPRPRHEGILRIRSTPACDILVDGHRTGLHTPQRSLELKPGKHTITLVNKKQKIRSTFSVRIKDGKTTRVTKSFRRPKKR